MTVWAMTTYAITMYAITIYAITISLIRRRPKLRRLCMHLALYLYIDKRTIVYSALHTCWEFVRQRPKLVLLGPLPLTAITT